MLRSLIKISFGSLERENATYEYWKTATLQTIHSQTIERIGSKKLRT